MIVVSDIVVSIKYNIKMITVSNIVVSIKYNIKMIVVSMNTIFILVTIDITGTTNYNSIPKVHRVYNSCNPHHLLQ